MGNLGIGLVFGLMALAVILVGAAVSSIFTASLYRYVTKGDGGTMFPKATLRQAFRAKA